MNLNLILLLGAVLCVLIILSAIALFSRYRKCASDQILVVFGRAGKKEVINEKTGKKETITTPSKIIHGGGTFVWPIIQDYKTMSLAPLQIQETIDGRSAQAIRVRIPVTLTTSIGTSTDLMQNAAVRMLSCSRQEQAELIKDILIGEVRNLLATLTIEEINADRDKFLVQAKNQIEPELNKLGYVITNLNSADVADEARYLDNLSKKAATEASAKAEADIAEQEKIGRVKVANTKKEEAIAIAAATRDKQTTVSATEQEQVTKVAEIEREKATKLAETAKNQETEIAELNAQRVANVAEAAAKAESAKAAAVAKQTAAVAAAQAEADSKSAESEALAEANVAKSKAEAESKKAEAEALKQTRIAQANQKKEAETQKAINEQEAAVARFQSAKRIAAANAAKEAGVAEQQATIEVSKAKGEAAEAAASAEKVAGIAKVNAEMSVAKIKQERQIEVNEAEAQATAAKLKAEQIVPAEISKKTAEIQAEQDKSIKTIHASAEAEAKKVQAKGEASAITEVASAEAQAIKLKGEAEAFAKKAKLEAEYNAEVNKAKGLSMAEVAGILQLAEKLGDPQAAVQYFLREQNTAIGVAEANSKMLHEVFGQVTVYGDSQTASNMAANMLSLVPQIKEAGKALGTMVSTVKDAWNSKPTLENKEEKDVNFLDVE